MDNPIAAAGIINIRWRKIIDCVDFGAVICWL